MAALIVAFAVATAPTSAAARIAQWQPLIDTAARRFGVPTDWITRVMRVESGGASMLGGRPTRSPAGAIGLMQIMPATWGDLRVAYSLGANPDDPGDNIMAGTAYLRLLYDRFGYPGLFAAYNAGPARYADYLAGRSGLPVETRAYLARLSGTPVPATITRIVPPAIFVLRHDSDTPDVSRPAGLFAIGATP